LIKINPEGEDQGKYKARAGLAAASYNGDVSS
jgi:hypothetical protein